MATLLLRFAGRSEVCTKSLVNKRANRLLQLSRCDIGFLPAIQPAIDDIKAQAYGYVSVGRVVWVAHDELYERKPYTCDKEGKKARGSMESH